MILKVENKKNSHYYYVMAWKGKKLEDVPTRKKKFDVYDDAVEYFNKSVNDFKPDCFVQMFEYIGGKRKIIADSNDGLIEKRI